MHALRDLLRERRPGRWHQHQRTRGDLGHGDPGFKLCLYTHMLPSSHEGAPARRSTGDSAGSSHWRLTSTQGTEPEQNADRIGLLPQSAVQRERVRAIIRRAVLADLHPPAHQLSNQPYILFVMVCAMTSATRCLRHRTGRDGGTLSSYPSRHNIAGCSMPVAAKPVSAHSVMVQRLASFCLGCATPSRSRTTHASWSKDFVLSSFSSSAS
jgi:hypothetical protein